MEKKVLTTFEVAKYCNVTMTTVVNWIKAGSLKAYKTKGGHRRIYLNDLLEFLNEYKMPVNIEKSILIVDDDEAIRVGLQKVLQDEGYTVHVAADGFQAGIIFEMKKPTLVILDLVMPGLDGHAVCSYIKNKKDIKHTKVLILTGFLSSENIEKSRKAGADASLAKPVSNENLIQEVKRLI